jgi:hypothetical protein
MTTPHVSYMRSGPSIRSKGGSPIRPPLIILCPPRSFSSVVCAMIGRHPELYAFPELNLFVTDQVATLLALAGDSGGFPGLGNYVSGIIRTVAELHFSGQNAAALAQAAAWLECRGNCATQEIMDTILAYIHPRAGVEKSTRTAMSHIAMERALAFYPQARFLHLTRHPVTAIESMRKCHLSFETREGPAWTNSGICGYCGHIWLHAHRSILCFTATLAPGQSMRMQAEKVLRDPDQHLASIISWLGLAHGPREVGLMKRPEDSPFAHHSGGLADDGDSSFLSDPRLREIPDDPRLELPAAWGLSRPLAADIIETGAALGYCRASP